MAHVHCAPHPGAVGRCQTCAQHPVGAGVPQAQGMPGVCAAVCAGPALAPLLLLPPLLHQLDPLQHGCEPEPHLLARCRQLHGQHVLRQAGHH